MGTFIFSDQMNQPYGEFITEVLQIMSENKIKCIGIVGILEDGKALGGYWNAECMDLGMMAQHIQADYIDHLTSANFSKYLEQNGIESFSESYDNDLEN